MDDALQAWTGNPRKIGFGKKLGFAVVDFQNCFTRDPDYLMDCGHLIQRAVENSTRVLQAARQAGAPVANCYTAYHSTDGMPFWKSPKFQKLLIEGTPGVALDTRIFDKDYDFAVRKEGASIFFQTAVAEFFRERDVDTVVVMGCVTSACVRASIVDSFQYRFRTLVPEDCVGDRELESHRANLRDVERRYCDVITADEVLDEIAKLSST